VSLRTETAYKAAGPDKSAQHAKARSSDPEVNSEVVQRPSVHKPHRLPVSALPSSTARTPMLAGSDSRGRGRAGRRRPGQRLAQQQQAIRA